MSSCLRYQNPKIYEHLASQYVAGNLTRRVRQRIENLSKTVPELDRAIADWADSFAELHEKMPHPAFENERLSSMWRSIDQRIVIEPTDKERQNKGSFFKELFVWKLATGVGALASLMMAIMLWNASLNQTVSGPSYLANMSVHNDAENLTQFVISAYAKNDDQPSRLHLQWTKSKTTETSFTNLHLWAEDKETGKLSYIGLKPKEGEAWNLTKATWKAITNSRRLIMTTDKTFTDENTVFSGICLQLKEWKV